MKGTQRTRPYTRRTAHIRAAQTYMSQGGEIGHRAWWRCRPRAPCVRLALDGLWRSRGAQQAMDDTTAKRAKLQHQYPVDNDEENEDSEGSQDSADGDLEPEEALSPMHHPMMKLVLHELTNGGMVLPLSASSGCKYRVAVGGDLPSHGVVRGVLHLEDVPGAHLDYSVSFEVGVMLEAELYDIADGVTPGFRRAARVMDIFETYVPPAERGKGHARRLAQAAFAVAHAYGYLVRPSCSYIADTFLAATPTITDWPMEKATGCDELLVLVPRRANLASCILPQ